MRLVSSKTDEEIAKERVSWQVAQALEELTANLMRVTRGAGKSYLLIEQASAFVEACVAFRDVAKVWPSSFELDGILALQEVYGSGATGDELERLYAERELIRGALQVVASDLVGQRTQSSSGRSQMYNGVNGLADLRHDVRRLKALEATLLRQAAATSVRRPKPAKKKPKAPSRTKE